MDLQAFLTQDETSDLLRISSRTLERFRGDGTGPRFVVAGRRVLYRRADIEEWANARSVTSTSEADLLRAERLGQST